MDLVGSPVVWGNYWDQHAPAYLMECEELSKRGIDLYDVTELYGVSGPVFLVGIKGADYTRYHVIQWAKTVEELVEFLMDPY